MEEDFGFHEEVRYPAEKLLEMCEARNFQKALSVAADETSKTGDETQFVCYGVPRGSFWIEKVVAGSAETTMSEHRVVAEVDGDYGAYDELSSYFDFHFEPPASGAVIPSDTDLKVFSGPQNEHPAFLAVGQVDMQGRATILIIKRPKGKIGSIQLQEYDEQIQANLTQEEECQLLSGMGLENFVVQFKKQRRKYHLTEESKKKVLEQGAGSVIPEF